MAVKDERLQIRISSKLKEKLEKVAREDNRTASNYVLNLIEKDLEGEKEMTINNVLGNIKNLIGKKIDTEEIIEAFEDYSFNDESEIIVNKSQNAGYDYVAYVDHKDAPQILLVVKEGILTDAWIA